MDYLWVSKSLGRSTSLLCYFLSFFFRDKQAKSRPLSHYPFRVSGVLAITWLSSQPTKSEAEDLSSSLTHTLSPQFSTTSIWIYIRLSTKIYPEHVPKPTPDHRLTFSSWVKIIYNGPHGDQERVLANLTSHADVTQENSWRNVSALERKIINKGPVPC
jgi:hypothetical protein